MQRWYISNVKTTFYSVDKKASALPWFRWEKNLSRLNVIRLLNVLLTLQGCRKRGVGGLGGLKLNPPTQFFPDQLTLSQPGGAHYTYPVLQTPSTSVELKLRWRFCVHASTWPEFSFLAKFWISFDISNTRSWLGYAQERNWNTI